MAIEISITQKAFTWLGGAFAEKSAISPFTHFAAGGFTEEEKADLQKNGILNAEGVMSPGCYAALEPLAAARRFASFRLASNYGVTERYVYFRDTARVSLDNAGDRVDITMPADNTRYVEFIRHFTGGSVLSNTSLSCELEPYDAQVFAALIDMSRIRALRLYAEVHAAGADFSFTAAEIAEFAAKRHSAGKWLTGVVQAIAANEFGLTEELVGEIAKTLYANNLAVLKDGKIALCGQAADFAANFLIVENVITLTVGAIDEASAGVSGTTCHFLQAGLSDILQIDPSGGKVRFDSVPAAVMLDYINALLETAPEI